MTQPWSCLSSPLPLCSSEGHSPPTRLSKYLGGCLAPEEKTREKGGSTHLHQENVLGALRLNLRVLDLHGHSPTVMQHCLVDLGKGSCPQGGVIEAQEQIMDLPGGEREESD